VQRSGHAALRADSLFAEVDMLDEHELAVIRVLGRFM
jgi:hypothetical protein